MFQDQFLFDLKELLKIPDTKFSQVAQSGYGSPLYSGIEAFSELSFDKIYSCGFMTKELVKYRHAELLYPIYFAINTCLKDYSLSTLLLKMIYL